MGEACLNEFSGAAGTFPDLSSASPRKSHFAWYVLKIRTGGERTAVAALRNRGFVPYCPTQKKSRRYSDRIKVVDEAVFPGYLFCEFDAQRKLPIISSPGVEYILGAAGGPIAVPEEELINIRRMVDAGASAVPSLLRGQRVRVTGGPLEGVEGTLVRNDTGNSLVVSIELLNQGACLHIDESNICPVEPCQ
jgi:transcription antitermination factor NusG